MRRPSFVVFLALAGCAEGISAGPVVERIQIPGGTFAMGSITSCALRGEPDCMGDRLPHQVTVSPFAIDQTEVSLVHYTVCVGKAAKGEPACPPAKTAWDWERRNRPVAVTLEQARTYCRLQGGRLPTEAEWELAARLTTSGGVRAYPWGDTPKACSDVPSKECAALEPRDVGTTPADESALGVRDLAANVPEWVDDDYVPAPGCVDEMPYEVACSENGSCVSALCSAPQSGCRSGCARGVGATPSPLGSYCAVATTPVVNPLHRTASPIGLVKGGGFQLTGCFQDPAMRSPVDLLPKDGAPDVIGFRCAYDVAGFKPVPSITHRIALPKGLDCSTVKVNVPTSDLGGASDAEVSAMSFALYNDGARVAASTSGRASTFACTGATRLAVLVVSGAPARALSLGLRIEDPAGCQSATLGLDAGEAALAAIRPEPSFVSCSP